VALRILKDVKILSVAAKSFVTITTKTLPYVGVLLSIGLEGRRGLKALDTGHNAMLARSGGQLGLSIGITYLATLGVAGAVTTGVGVAVVLVVGAVLIAISFLISMVQLYIARSRIEDFLSMSFLGNAPTLRYWDEQSRPSSAELLEESRAVLSQDEGVDVRRYFEAELDAFYYMLFSPIVRITEHIGRHWDINRGEHQVMSEMTSFVVYLPGYSDGSCTYSIRLFEVDTNWFEKDEPKDISDLFHRRKQLDASTGGVLFRFDHYNHNKCDQLEMLIEYEKDGRKVTGENGLRIILDGNDVEELGVDERLAYEV